MDDLLIGYALDLLDPADRAAVAAHLAAHPADAAKVARVRRAVALMAADADKIDPPPGLAAAAVARTAEYLAARGLAPVPDARAEPAAPRRGWRDVTGPVFAGGWAGRWADLAAAAAVAVLAVGLGLAGVGKLRHENRVRACQESLRELSVALAGYADAHGGRYPEVGTPAVPVAGAFAAELARAGQLPPGGVPGCPDATPAGAAVGYSYTLGYVGPAGRPVGLRRADGPAGASDWAPVAADLPPVWAGDPAGPVPVHASGQNVLYFNGAVRFAATPAAGVNGDDIYRNAAGLVRAGLHKDDASLGRPADVP